MPIELKSKGQWLSQADTAIELRKQAVEKHRRVVEDLEQFQKLLNGLGLTLDADGGITISNPVRITIKGPTATTTL